MMRALRQLLGLWGKSDRTIPATFRQPGAPDTRVLVVDSQGATNAEIRLAIRGLARGDREALTANVLALIIRDRWKTAVPDLSRISVRDEAHVLPGIFVLSASAPTSNAAKAAAAAQDIIKSLIQTGPTAQELESARGAVLNQLAAEFSQPETMSTHWLEMDTFKSTRPSTVATLIRSLTPGDIQRVTARLFKDVAMATVVAGNSEQLKATFTGNVEIKSAVAPEPNRSILSCRQRNPDDLLTLSQGTCNHRPHAMGLTKPANNYLKITLGGCAKCSRESLRGTIF